MSSTWTHTGYAQQILFGSGRVRELSELLRTRGVRQALLVTTPGRLASPDGEEVQRRVGRSLASTFAEVESHVPAPIVQLRGRAEPAPAGAERAPAGPRAPIDIGRRDEIAVQIRQDRREADEPDLLRPNAPRE